MSFGVELQPSIAFLQMLNKILFKVPIEQPYLFAGHQVFIERPEIGSVFMRRNKRDGVTFYFVVAKIGIQNKGNNAGIIKNAITYQVTDIEDGHVIYEDDSREYNLFLTGAGTWFTRVMLKEYELEWVKDLSSINFQPPRNTLSSRGS